MAGLKTWNERRPWQGVYVFNSDEAVIVVGRKQTSHLWIVQVNAAGCRNAQACEARLSTAFRTIREKLAGYEAARFAGVPL